MRIYLGAILLLFFLFPAAYGAAVPAVINYSGILTDDGQVVNGEVFFKFSFINKTADVTYWSNDQTGNCSLEVTCEPENAVGIIVSEGRFNIKLGDTSLVNMTMNLSPSLFSVPDIYLRVWHSTSSAGPFETLSPDRQLASSPFAFVSEFASNLTGTDIVSTSMLLDDSITSRKILDASITSADMADRSITSAKIADDSITSAHITDATVSGLDIAPGSIGNDHIQSGANISASKIDSTGLDADSLDGLDSSSFIKSSGGVGGVMTGVLTVTDIILASAKTLYFSIPGTAFRPIDVNTTTEACAADATNKAVSMKVKGANSLFYAPVNLADGAEMKELMLNYWQKLSPTGQITAQIFRAGINAPNAGTDVVTIVSLAPAIKINSTYFLEQVAITGPVIVDNSLFTYMVEIDMAGAGDYCLNAVRIKYEVLTP